MRITALLCAVVGLTASSLLAEDRTDPPWDSTLPNQTSQSWDYTADPLDPVVIFSNPYGEPSIDWGNAAPQSVPGWDGTDIGTMHIGEGDGDLWIWIPNNEDDNLYKMIFWQVTSDKSPTPTGDWPETSPPGTGGPGVPPQVGLGGDWYVYNGVNVIQPNPEGEWLHFSLAYSTNVAEIVIDTVCMPEPATLGLLAAGAGLAFLRRRR
jgi:hypothetical protein